MIKILMQFRNLIKGFAHGGLFERSLEKRRNATASSLRFFKSFIAKGNQAQIEKLMTYLLQNFLNSSKVKNQQGGLAMLSLVAVALGPEMIESQLDNLMCGALMHIYSNDKNIKFTACECLYNIIKVSRKKILGYFEILFNVLLKLCSDVDMKVRSAAEIVNMLLGNIIIENQELWSSKSSNYMELESKESCSESGIFTQEMFVDMISKQTKVVTPETCSFIIEWISLFNSIPETSFMPFLPRFIGDLFSFMEGENENVSSGATELLDNFLGEYSATHDYLKIFNEEHFNKMTDALVPFINSKDEYVCLMALKWTEQVIILRREIAFPLHPALLDCLFNNASGKSKAVREAIEKTANLLRSSIINFVLKEYKQPSRMSIQDTSEKDAYKNSLLIEFCESLSKYLKSGNEYTSLEILNWFSALYDQLGHQEEIFVVYYLQVIICVLSDKSHRVFDESLKLLCVLEKDSDDTQFELIVKNLVKMFRKNVTLLEENGCTIIRSLSASGFAEKFYSTISRIIEQEEDLFFSKKVISALNLVLITTSNLEPIRNILRALEVKQNAEFFVTLYTSWSCCPISLFSLCLIAVKYEHAFRVLSYLMTTNMDSEIIKQVDQLVNLLETSVFTRLRFQLLHPQDHPYLIKCLCGLLALLPQSHNYDLLMKRLSITTLSGTQTKEEYKICDTCNPQEYSLGGNKCKNLGEVFEDFVPWDSLFMKYVSLNSGDEPEI